MDQRPGVSPAVLYWVLGSLAVITIIALIVGASLFGGQGL
jgi:hypothetical protein